MTDLMLLLTGAEAVVAEAAAKLALTQGSALRTERKDLLDIVTEADLAAEEIVVSGLKRLTPDAGILAEERGSTGEGSGERWIIDPLDGTVNYARGLPWFSVTVAYEVDGEVRLGLVNAPKAGLIGRYVRGQLALIDDKPARVTETRTLADAVVSVTLTSHFSAADVRRTIAIVERLAMVARGVRVVVSGGLEMSLVASSRLDAFVSIKADAVSHAAAMQLVRAGGGQVTTLQGHASSVDDLHKVASNGHIHEELLAQLRDALRESTDPPL
ncbi:MAG: inositol monophosphatase [Pseudomonadota bacterium]|nr:inositol monophosphatase [Pseudomonadota bacterium]